MSLDIKKKKLHDNFLIVFTIKHNFEKFTYSLGSYSPMKHLNWNNEIMSKRISITHLKNCSRIIYKQFTKLLRKLTS